MEGVKGGGGLESNAGLLIRVQGGLYLYLFLGCIMIGMKMVTYHGAMDFRGRTVELRVSEGAMLALLVVLVTSCLKVTTTGKGC